MLDNKQEMVTLDIAKAVTEQKNFGVTPNFVPIFVTIAQTMIWQYSMEMNIYKFLIKTFF